MYGLNSHVCVLIRFYSVGFECVFIVDCGSVPVLSATILPVSCQFSVHHGRESSHGTAQFMVVGACDKRSFTSR